MARERDSFTPNVKLELERRVACMCSKPGCGRITTGPSSDPRKSLRIGEAAHITSAAPGGPRYDDSLTSAERRSADNGIWLCAACHKIVDSDEAPYGADLLRQWKIAAEARARDAVELARQRDEMPSFVPMLHRSMELIPQGSLERSMPVLLRNVVEVVADVREPCARLADIDHVAAVNAQIRARNELWAVADATPRSEIAYYGIAHVPLAIHMGHLLGTRISVQFAERERDGPGWRWLDHTDSGYPPLLVVSQQIPPGATDVAIAISVSYRVRDEYIVASVGEMPIVQVGVANPALDVVRSVAQVEAYSGQFRETLESVARLESVRRVHLFAAAPMCLSFALGRQVRGSVHPDVFAYNFRRGAARPYSWRLLMTDDPARAEAEARW